MRLKSLEECSPAERDLLTHLKNKLSHGRGIPVGVVGTIERPVFLVQGELILYRKVAESCKQRAYDLAEVLSSQFRSIPPPFFIEIASDQELWYGRRFFESTLEEGDANELSRESIARNIVEVFTPLISARKVHGHIIPSNLVCSDGELYLVDGGLSNDITVTIQKEWEHIVEQSLKLLSSHLSRNELSTFQGRGLSAKNLPEKITWLESLSGQQKKAPLSHVTRPVGYGESPLYPETATPEVASKGTSHQKTPQGSGALYQQGSEQPASLPPPQAPSSPPVQPSTASSNGGLHILIVLVACLAGFLVYRNYERPIERNDTSLLSGWARGDVRSIGEVLDTVAQDPNSPLIGTVEKDFSREIPWGFEVDPRPFFLKGVGKVSHTPEDISAAIALSIRREDLLTDDRIDNLSPAGVLYVCGALERPVGTESADPVRKLQILPAPLGATFKLAAKLGELAHLSDTKLRILCRLSWGTSDAVPEVLITELFKFSGKEQLQTKAAVMLLLLAKVSEINNGIPPVARSVLRTTDYKDLIAREKWFNELHEVWDGIPGASVLELIAGSYPEPKTLTLQAKTDLTSYPNAEVSAQAKRGVIEEFPGLQKEGVGNVLASSKFNRTQKTLLISALTSNPEFQYGFFQKWFSGEPNPETVLIVLSKGGFPESFNIAAVRYLQVKGTPVSMKILPDLLVHADKVVRAFGYALIPTDTEAGMVLLKKAIAFEKDPALKARIEGLLKN